MNNTDRETILTTGSSFTTFKAFGFHLGDVDVRPNDIFITFKYGGFILNVPWSKVAKVRVMKLSSVVTFKFTEQGYLNDPAWPGIKFSLDFKHQTEFVNQLKALRVINPENIKNEWFSKVYVPLKRFEVAAYTNESVQVEQEDMENNEDLANKMTKWTTFE